MAASGLPHRHALDGVRGAAVLAVLLFHAGHLEGGFLGVDLFFVLSGFLITSLLLVEMRGTGQRGPGRLLGAPRAPPPPCVVPAPRRGRAVRGGRRRAGGAAPHPGRRVGDARVRRQLAVHRLGLRLLRRSSPRRHRSTTRGASRSRSSSTSCGRSSWSRCSRSAGSGAGPTPRRRAGGPSSCRSASPGCSRSARSACGSPPRTRPACTTAPTLAHRRS